MGNSKKKLVGLTILMTLLTVVIVFSAVIFLNNYSKVRLLNQFILELPKILQDREEELDSRKPVFEEDALARGELGVWIYKEESGLSAGEKHLQRCRSFMAALKWRRQAISLKRAVQSGFLTPVPRWCVRMSRSGFRSLWKRASGRMPDSIQKGLAGGGFSIMIGAGK